MTQPQADGGDGAGADDLEGLTPEEARKKLMHNPFKPEDWKERLKQSPLVGHFVESQEFCDSIEDIREDPSRLKEYMEDPRIVQAMSVMEGMEISCTKDDYYNAYMANKMRHNDERRDERERVRLEKEAFEALSPEDAKLIGNDYFKEGDNSEAMRYYNRAWEVAAAEEAKGEAEAAAVRDLLVAVAANKAAVQLKQMRLDQAEASCDDALKRAPRHTKSLFRRSQAREGLYKYGDAMDDMNAAVAAAEAEVEEAVAEVKRTGSTMQKRQPMSQPAVKRCVAEVKRLKDELVRLRKQAEKDEAYMKREAERKQGEKESQALRENGHILAADAKLQEVQGALIPSPYATKSQDKDWTFWAKQRLAALAKECRKVHMPNGGTVGLGDFKDEAFEGHCLIKTKFGKKVLYYEMDVTYRMVVSVPDGKEGRTKGFDGAIRVYNIGQDTQYCPGGDPANSYLYATMFDPRAPTKEPWVIEAMEHAHELFHTVCEVVGKVLGELLAK